MECIENSRKGQTVLQWPRGASGKRSRVLQDDLQFWVGNDARQMLWAGRKERAHKSQVLTGIEAGKGMAEMASMANGKVSHGNQLLLERQPGPRWRWKGWGQISNSVYSWEMKDWHGLKLQFESWGKVLLHAAIKKETLQCQVWVRPSPSQRSLSSGHVTTFFFLLLGILSSLAFHVCSSELRVQLSPLSWNTVSKIPGLFKVTVCLCL